MGTADTSWLVALFNPDDTHHAKAAAAAKGLPIIRIPNAILSEFLQVVLNQATKTLGRGPARKHNREILRAIEERPQFRIEPTSAGDLEAAHRMFHRDQALTHFDAVAAAHGQEDDLLSFDEDQIKSHSKGPPAS